MDPLKGFEDKDFIEQVTVLREIESQKQHNAIPGLFMLCRNKNNNDQVQFMAENTLRALLSENEAETINGLTWESNNVKKICIQVSGQNFYKTAVPVLIDLLSKASSETDDGISLFDILSALSGIQAPEALDIFRKHLNHIDPLISHLAIETIGNYGDESSVDALCSIISDAEKDDRYEVCDVTTASAVESLGKIRNDKAISFLVSKIHHRNPTVRRFVHQVLVEIGEKTIPDIAMVFDHENVDEKIMAANVLGRIGGRKAGDVLVNAIDKGAASEINIKFAVFEALGNIPSMKSLVCLSDGLVEKDDSLLIAVMDALNNQVNPGLIEKIKDVISSDEEQGHRLIKAIVAACADVVFSALYSDKQFAPGLMKALSESNNADTIAVFRKVLESTGGQEAMADAKTLKEMLPDKTGQKILAVDDSMSMLRFYQSIASDMGLDITTAENGRDALDILEKGETFDLILTDMNMPVMDGIEMTRKLRENSGLGHVPVIMATTESEKAQSRLAEKAGVNDFIKKPFTADQLKTYINKTLG